MELNYKQRANGVYILSKEDIEKIATDTLKEFSPQNLDYPTALDTDSFLVDHLGLLLKERYLGIPGYESVLGLTVMCESAEILTLDYRCRPTVVEENCGTVVISTALNSINNKGRKRYNCSTQSTSKTKYPATEYASQSHSSFPVTRYVADSPGSALRLR